MAVKITRKMATSGKGVNAYKFIIRKDEKGDIRTYQHGRDVERDVRDQKPSPLVIEPKAKSQ